MMIHTNKPTATVETVRLFASNGRYIKKTTRVTINGRSVTFMDRLPKGKAIAQAQEVLARG